MTKKQRYRIELKNLELILDELENGRWHGNVAFLEIVALMAIAERLEALITTPCRQTTKRRR